MAIGHGLEFDISVDMTLNMSYTKPFEPAIPFLGDSRNFALYLREIRRYNTLTSAEEAELARRIREGDQQALNRLVCCNLKFVISVCRNYTHLGLTLPDLINEGNLGLIRAAKRFDETRQFRFISYAVWWVRQSVLQALADQSRLVKLPPNRVGMLQRIGKTNLRLEQSLGRPPTWEELSEEMQVDIPILQESARIGLQPVSLDAPRSSGEEGNSLSEILKDENGESPDEALTALEIHHAIENALHSLNAKEEGVLRLYFGINTGATLSLEEIGIRLGITRERVRQIKETALRKLRQASRAKPLYASTIGGQMG
jgi:RNA polymerase primary sigma factor